MLKNSSWSKVKGIKTNTYDYLYIILELDETNLANFGSDLEREHRKEEGSLETAWNYEDSPIGHQV